MADKKNLVEEALLQMENLQEAITNNAKGILASTMKEEISELVKESLEEQVEEVLADPNKGLLEGLLALTPVQDDKQPQVAFVFLSTCFFFVKLT